MGIGYVDGPSERRGARGPGLGWVGYGFSLQGAAVDVAEERSLQVDPDALRWHDEKVTAVVASLWSVPDSRCFGDSSARP